VVRGAVDHGRGQIHERVSLAQPLELEAGRRIAMRRGPAAQIRPNDRLDRTRARPASSSSMKRAYRSLRRWLRRPDRLRAGRAGRGTCRGTTRSAPRTTAARRPRTTARPRRGSRSRNRPGEPRRPGPGPRSRAGSASALPIESRASPGVVTPAPRPPRDDRGRRSPRAFRSAIRAGSPPPRSARRRPGRAAGRRASRRVRGWPGPAARRPRRAS
jgi:hypothetical protein